MNKETIFVHDASDGRLIIRNADECTEEVAEKIADGEGMRFNDCEWGCVSSMVVEGEIISKLFVGF